MDPDRRTLKFLKISHPLSDRESLLCAPGSHLLPSLRIRSQSTFDGFLELTEHMRRRSRFNSKPPTRHLTQSSDTCTNTQRPLPPKLDGNQPKRLIPTRNQRKLCPGKDVRRQRSKFWLRINPPRIHLHQRIQLQRRKLAI